MKPAATSLILALILTTSSSPYSHGQQKAAGDSRATLHFTVVNKQSWRFVDGLRKGDFSIFEDGVKQDVIEVSRSERPLSIVLLMDLSGSMRDIIEPTRLVTLQALQNLKPEDEVAIITFAKTSAVVQDFTKDKKLITDRIGGLAVNQELGKSTELDQAVYQAAVHMKAHSSVEARRVLFIVTDNVAERYPEHLKKAALRELSSFGGVVCALLVPNGTGLESTRRRFTVPPRVGPQRRQDGVPTTLTDLSQYSTREQSNIDSYTRQTGGIALRFEGDEEGTGRAAMLDLFRVYYTIDYEPLGPRPDGKSRKVKLKISPDVAKREGDLIILSPQGKID